MSLQKNNTSIVDLIMATLGSARSSYLFKSILRERRLRRYKKESVESTFYRLHTKGYIKKVLSGWKITPKGMTYVKNKKERNLLSYIESPFAENQPHTTIVAFDIPEQRRVVRNWLRNQIKIFGFKMLQQSLWIGPGPLPASFIERLEYLNIRKNIKTFKIKRGS